MSPLSSFAGEFFREIARSLSNEYTDNFDYLRSPELLSPSYWNALKRLARCLLHRFGLARTKDITLPLFRSVELIEFHLERFQALYGQLADQQSKELLIKLLAFRCLGPTKVRLPLSTPAYWEGIKSIDLLADKGDFLQTNFMGWQLYRINLRSIGFPIELYFTPKGAYAQFVAEQYSYRVKAGSLQADEGDFVIDAGGCWGDTALYFAQRVGVRGKVFCFEFIPTNLEIFRKNLTLNPELSKRVELVDRPLWDESCVPIYYTDNGPASDVGLEQRSASQQCVSSYSVDDFVTEHNLRRVDFIKMDIEGAELRALRGATQTIKTFKPKLAIAVYHRVTDFYTIPEFIRSLNPGYRLYLKHLTIHVEETILFADMPT